jgi:hypothetical protein
VKRRLFNLLAVLSLLLCVAMAALWVRSYWQYELVSANRYHSWDLWLEQGEFELAVGTRYAPQTTPPRLPLVRHPLAGGQRAFSDHWEFLHQSQPGAATDRCPIFLPQLGFSLA